MQQFLPIKSIEHRRGLFHLPLGGKDLVDVNRELLD